MPLHIEHEEEDAMRPTANQRLFRTVNDEVVHADHPDARFLLCTEGEEIPPGYEVPDDYLEPVDDEPVEKQASKPANKKASKPADKSVEPAEDK